MSPATPETDFTVTPQALTILERYFSDNPPSPMRLIHATGGCAGERLALTLEDADPGTEDTTIVQDGYQFTVTRELLQKAGPITVDANRLGFIIHSSMELDQGGCASCTSCPSGSG
ncbi:hypothetical protein [Desulfonatronum thioautotrophicum]|uniref:hypothetical protein n=1 Tax=Desulfonatronum thioautotrophicum TaxID=617001 RepID=UPI0005EB57F5|nr:hypothetical protein [Desulfonatronum thioautotrophicum]